MTTANAAFKTEILAILDSRIANITARQAQHANTLVDTNKVIRVGQCFLRVHADGIGSNLTGCEHATAFREAFALTLAPKVQNGLGEFGQVVGLQAALAEELAEVQTLRDQLTNY